MLLIQPRWWTEERGNQARDAALALKGRPYDFSGLVGLSDDERFYCSELAFHVYEDHQTPWDDTPAVIEPGQMYLWGKVLWDSGVRGD